MSDKFQDNSDVDFNRVFLRAFDNQLKSVGNKTVASKADLYLNSARREYLDYFGSWIGLERLNSKESDDHYRQRLINHIKHPRVTIPALRSTISKYLHDNFSDVHIYEPWQDAFLSNDYASRTNSRSHLYGYYYRPAIINIVVDKPFADKGVIDYINWFRPVGTAFLLTYDSGQNGNIWYMPAVSPVWEDMIKTDYIGFGDMERHDLDFLDKNPDYGENPFYVSQDVPQYKYRKKQTYQVYDGNKIRYLWKNDGTEITDDPSKRVLLSDLNSDDLLVDTADFNHEYYSYLGTLHALLDTSDHDTMNGLLFHTDIVDPDTYPNINTENGLSINVSHSTNVSNMLSHTFDLKGDWNDYADHAPNYVYASGLSDNGRSAMIVMHKGSYIEDDEGRFIDSTPTPNDEDVIDRMAKGRRYYISADLSVLNPARGNSQYNQNIYFKVRVDKDQTVQIGGRCFAGRFTHFTNSFIYDGSSLVPPRFTYSSGSGNAAAEIASPVYSPQSSDWSPSYSDLDTRPNSNGTYSRGSYRSSPNSEYIYGFINIWKFYFTHIESRESTYRHITGGSDEITPTANQLNAYISKHFNHKFFDLTYVPRIHTNINTRLWIMDYRLSTFTDYDNHNGVMGEQRDTYHLQVNDIAPLVNSKGMFVFALQVPAFKNDYTLDLTHLGLSFERFYPDEQSIKMYKPYPSIMLWGTKTDYIPVDMFSDDSEVNSFNERSRGRAQRHYPIRYIRNWIRNVSYGNRHDNGFITNDSDLNSKKLLNDFHRVYYHPYFKNWLRRPILPSLTDDSNPVKSISVLGIHADDDYPSNRLNNLLKNSIFRYFDTTRVWGHSSVTPPYDKNDTIKNKNSVFMLKDVNSDHVWFNNQGAKLWTTTESIGARNRYTLSFSAKTDSGHDKVFNVRVKLFSNHFSQDLDKVIVIPRKRMSYDLSFNTYGIYPDHVQIIWTYLGNSQTYPELFQDLKDTQLTFGKLRKFQAEFGDIRDHKLLPDGSIQIGSTKVEPNKKINITKTCKRRVDIVYMPKEPCYVDSGNSLELTPPPKHNKDIDPGWSYNGLVPEDLTPAVIPSPSGKGYASGYIPSEMDTSNLQLSYVPDGKGDYALGYTFKKGIPKGWDYAQIEDPDTGGFTKCLVPKKFIYYTAPNINPAEIEFRDIACRLSPIVYVDGKKSDHIAPQIDYKGQDTLAYNDVIFGQPLNMNDLGRTMSDLSRYANDFSKDYSSNIQWLISHVISGNLTWQDLEDKNVDWGMLQKGGYTWSPTFNINDVTDRGALTLPEDTLTFYDIEHEHLAERFSDLKQYHNQFSQFNTLHVTFEDLKNDWLNQVGFEEVHTFANADKYGWIFRDGEPFDNQEHEVTIDLGRTYTNIDHLFVHHGSNSVMNVVYDSCLQTSIDGKHWHTWYDNYKGTRDDERLDKDYIEPKDIPMSFPVARYDCLNSRQDYEHRLPTSHYVHSQLIHYPVKSLSSLIFNDDRHRVPLFSQQYGETDSIQTPLTLSLSQLKKYKLNIKPTRANEKGLNAISLSQSDNSDKLSLTKMRDSDSDVSSNGYWNDIPVPAPSYLSIKFDPKIQSQLALADFTASNIKSVQAFRAANPDTRSLAKAAKGVPSVTHQASIYHKIAKFNAIHTLFTNDTRTLLNSKSVLQSGKGVPTVNHWYKGKYDSSNGDLPNPSASQYMYDEKLLRFDLHDVISRQYPNVYANLKKHGIKNTKAFTSGLFANCSTLTLMLNVATDGNWSVAVWDYKTESWQNAQLNSLNGMCMLQLTEFLDDIKEGYLYVLVRAEVPAFKEPYLNVVTSDLRIMLDLDKVDDYDGGLYPHLNYEYNDNTLYSVSPQDKMKVLKLPWISKKVLGHKITVSFNMVADVTGDDFMLSLGRLHSSTVQIEKAYQNFSFVFDIPNDLTDDENITPRLELYGNIAHIKVYGFKAELGIKQTPYYFPITSGGILDN